MANPSKLNELITVGLSTLLRSCIKAKTNNPEDWDKYQNEIGREVGEAKYINSKITEYIERGTPEDLSRAFKLLVGKMLVDAEEEVPP